MAGTDSRRSGLTRGGRQWHRGNLHFCAVRKLLETAVGYFVARMNAFDSDHPRVGDARLHVSYLRLAILNQVHERRVAIVLHRGRRNENLLLQGSHPQTRVHKLVREKCIILIVEGGAQPYRSRAYIDMVIYRAEYSGADFFLLLA